MEWFAAAARADKRTPAALATAACLHRAAMMQGTLTPVMPTKALKLCGVSLDARRCALGALTSAGLVILKPRRHRSPQVTVICAWLDEHLRG
jgi:hypothetical protein